MNRYMLYMNDARNNIITVEGEWKYDSGEWIIIKKKDGNTISFNPDFVIYMEIIKGGE